MSSQVIRVPNGGSIQVRSGVLRGIGPAGPVGPVGPQGPQGDKGDQGDTGATGALNDFSSLIAASIVTPMAANTDTVIPLDTVWWDNLSLFTSSTTFTIQQAGSYLINVTMTIAKGTPDATNGREMWIQQLSPATGVIARVSVAANPKSDTKFVMEFPRLWQQGDTFQIKARHSDTISLSMSACTMTVYRLGAGPRGLTGPQGPVGAVGPAGPQGATGPAGNASSGFATYEDLRP